MSIRDPWACATRQETEVNSGYPGNIIEYLMQVSVLTNNSSPVKPQFWPNAPPNLIADIPEKYPEIPCKVTHLIYLINDFSSVKLKHRPITPIRTCRTCRLLPYSSLIEISDYSERDLRSGGLRLRCHVCSFRS